MVGYDTPAAMRAGSPTVGATNPGLQTKLVDTVEMITVMEFT
jgi:hypothetical protein